MTTEKPERDGVEAALEAKVAAWQGVLDAYRAAKATDGSGGDLASGLQVLKGAPVGSFDLPVGALRTKSVPDAIKLLLSAGRRKQTNKEIAAGLRQGGLETTGGNFDANIAAALFRLKKAGVVLRFKDGWDLAEHYPDRIRNKLENGAKPNRTTKSKIRKRSASSSRRKTRAHQPKAQAASGQQANPRSLDQRILEFLDAVAPTAQRYSPKDTAKAIDETDTKAVGMAFARLVRFGKVIRGNDGLYAAARPRTEHLKREAS